MTGGSARRLGAAALAVATPVVAVESDRRARDDAQRSYGDHRANMRSPGVTQPHYTVSLTDGTDDDATVNFTAGPRAQGPSDVRLRGPAWHGLTVLKEGSKTFTVDGERRRRPTRGTSRSLRHCQNPVPRDDPRHASVTDRDRQQRRRHRRWQSAEPRGKRGCDEPRRTPSSITGQYPASQNHR